MILGFAYLTLVQRSSNVGALDFWIGTWTVEAQGIKDGTDVVEKILNGRVVLEDWTDVAGKKGESFFYFMPSKGQWKQVWVTPVVYKEKFSAPVPNGIQFAGRVYLPDGRSLNDRTTLTKLPDGTVHQVIEYEKNGKWIISFDALYRKTRPGD